MVEIRSAREINVVLMDALHTQLDAAGVERVRATLHVCARIAPVATSKEAVELAELTSQVAQRLKLYEQLTSARAMCPVDAAGVVSEQERWRRRAERALEQEAGEAALSPQQFVELVVCKRGLARLEGGWAKKLVGELMDALGAHLDVDEAALGAGVWPDVGALCRQLDGAGDNALEAQRSLMAADDVLLYAAQLEEWENPDPWWTQAVEQVMAVVNARRHLWVQQAPAHVSAVVHSFALEGLHHAAAYRLWCGV